ncbi:hypothetical protein CC117_01785 [Parafrankia colletiae]|uniref:Uncharacterized protein n=1 Tax=Parafrankia colletiae TaxID=573497 RepID=A0A1S1RLW7_9ACTN|nr:hypothetical protein [Parafrankia colletiae]OHV46395.1 hypothetical protein CC117_01785 [Parafrankia colletiae]
MSTSMSMSPTRSSVPSPTTSASAAPAEAAVLPEDLGSDVPVAAADTAGADTAGATRTDVIADVNMAEASVTRTCDPFGSAAPAGGLPRVSGGDRTAPRERGAG